MRFGRRIDGITSTCLHQTLQHCKVIATRSSATAEISRDADDFSVDDVHSALTLAFKGVQNIDKKWQSDDLFYIIMNEIRPRVDQF